MKQYPNIISKLFREPLVITPARHSALCQLVEKRMGANVMDDDDMGGPSGDDDTEEIQVEGSTAIIPVHGTLVMHPEDIARSECGCDMETLGQKIDFIENDRSIQTVIYDFRTPGGSVTGIPEVARKIRNSDKNTIAFTQSECCSGGLWLAAQCQNFYSTQSSRVGSCGVYCMAIDLSKQLKEDGVSIEAIFAGKYKLMGAYWKPLTDSEREIMQGGVDKIYAQFKEAMESYRVVNDSHFGNGLTFDGDDAEEIGFTDGVAEDISEAIDMAQA